MIHEIQQAFEKFGKHIQERRTLREIFSNSDLVCVRIFDSQGRSEISTIPKNLLGFDGFYGEYVKQGGKIDLIGCDKNGVITASVKLGDN